MRTSLHLADVEDRLPQLADAVFSELSFGLGRKNPTPIEHELLDYPACEGWSSSGTIPT